MVTRQFSGNTIRSQNLENDSTAGIYVGGGGICMQLKNSIRKLILLEVIF